MADNQQWLDAGLAILEKQGAKALTIERLAEQIGLSKGSFYHHFGGMPGYKTALLAHFEATYTTQYIDAVERDLTADAITKLRALIDLVCEEGEDQSIEVGLRAWALQDPEVYRAQERIDRLRGDHVRGLWLEFSGDEAQADLIGRLLQVLLIGAEQVLPPVPQGELRRLYEFVLGLAYDEGAADTGTTG
ncbi:MAG: TetR/AcrR family transcriptional regulator [Geodermatophilaceae bacterium]|nr:TetR/AcrR family transcriptional regulator [Geodermatophilaceae bacterium]MDQ3476276.1 TetR/AcrR family transcriptional regulator [Actinomycetota bacterium]